MTVNITQQEAMVLIVRQEQTIRALEMAVAGFTQRERSLTNTIELYKRRVIAFADAWAAFDARRKVGGLKEEMPTAAVESAAAALGELATLAKTGKNT